MRTLIIHAAETGYASDAIFQFERLLLREGDECLMRQVGASWDPQGIQEEAKAFDLVVLSGGDYEICRWLWALAHSPVAVCVFPSGPVNLFFSALGDAAEPFALANACRMGHTIAGDLARIRWKDDQGQPHDRGFCIMAGTGFDAELMRAAASNRQAMGQAAYLLAALSNPTPPLIHYSLTIDGRPMERDGIACIVANTAMIQADIEIVPDCKLNDGLLDVIILETPDAVGLLKPILFGFLDPSGRHLGRPQIESFKGASIAVSASEPVPLQVDGEPEPTMVDGFEAQVTPGAVRLIVDPLSPYFDATVAHAPRFPDTGIRPQPLP